MFKALKNTCFVDMHHPLRGARPLFGVICRMVALGTWRHLMLAGIWRMMAPAAC